jgi:hypothetical protein
MMIFMIDTCTINTHMSIIDVSRSVNATFRVVRMTIISDATTWSITYNSRSVYSRDVIYDRDIFMIQATS